MDHHSWLQLGYPCWLQECYLEHRGGDTSVCTGIVDRKCDPVAICQLAVDNVKGLDVFRDQLDVGSPKLKGPKTNRCPWHTSKIIQNLRFYGLLAWKTHWLSSIEQASDVTMIWVNMVTWCHVSWIFQGFTKVRFNMTPRFFSGDDVPWFSHTIWPFLEEHEDLGGVTPMKFHKMFYSSFILKGGESPVSAQHLRWGRLYRRRLSVHSISRFLGREGNVLGFPARLFHNSVVKKCRLSFL